MKNDIVGEKIQTHLIRAHKVAGKFRDYMTEASHMFSVSEAIHRSQGDYERANTLRTMITRGQSIAEEFKEVFTSIGEDLEDINERIDKLEKSLK